MPANHHLPACTYLALRVTCHAHALLLTRYIHAHDCHSPSAFMHMPAIHLKFLLCTCYSVLSCMPFIATSHTSLPFALFSTYTNCVRYRNSWPGKCISKSSCVKHLVRRCRTASCFPPVYFHQHSRESVSERFLSTKKSSYSLRGGWRHTEKPSYCVCVQPCDENLLQPHKPDLVLVAEPLHDCISESMTKKSNCNKLAATNLRTIVLLPDSAPAEGRS